MIIILIFTIFVVLFYILYLNNKESFTDHISNNTTKENNNTTTENEITLDYTLNNQIDGPTAYIKNIKSFSNGFYEQISHENTDKSDCVNDSDCGINGACVQTDNIKRCNKIINKEAFKFISANKSHIVIPNVSPDNINLHFMVLISNIKQSQPIISTSNNTCELLIDNSKFLVNIYENTKDKNIVKKTYANFTLKNNKVYEISLQSDNKTLDISLDKRIISLPLVNKLCLDNNDCGDNGSCIRNPKGQNYCLYNKIELLLGKNDTGYFDGYIGDIYFNYDKEAIKVHSCQFDTGKFKNKRICIEECKRDKNCNETSCETLCNSVSKCEFEAEGRHAEDCIQKCIENKDCDFQHCNEKCKNCGKSCPWNNISKDDKYNSDYYDKKGRPSPSKINLQNISIDSKKVSFKWKQPYQGMSQINGYISYIYKTFNKSEGVRINQISTVNCSEFCNYVFEDFEPNETYTLGIKAYNSYGLGKISNLVTFKPEIKTLGTDFSVVPNIDESVIGEFNYCNVED